MNIPRELVEQFARGNGAIFVGAGLSIGTGLPGWGDLVCRLAAEIEGYPTDASYQDIAQYYANEHGPHRLVTRLREELDTFKLKPTSVHEALVRLPVNPIFTTNYDDLLEQALRTAKRRFDLVVGSGDPGFWSSDRLQLVKLHGDLSQPKSIVITAEDYERYFDDHPALARQLAGALQTRTVLFLGYSATDPDFRQLLTRVRSEAGGLARNAFAVLFNAVKFTVKDLERRGIRVINLEVAAEPSDEEATRPHRRNQVLTVWLDELHRQVQVEARRLSKRPIIRRQPLPPEPYKFLDFFTSKDAAIFHGRKLDTDRLTSLILTYPLSILYGESGTGKTSLIQAAVLPCLEEEGYSVVYARPLSDPLKTVQEAILDALRDGLATRPETSSLHALVEGSLPVGGRLLIVLDQFEEFFIRQGPETRAHFIHELIDLLNTPEREVRCLLSLRSEYLDRLDALELPLGRDPLRHRMRLHNLGPAGANAAIAEPAAAFGIRLELPLLEQLLTDLEQVGIAPPQLQIVCYVLWQDWQKRGKPQDGLTLDRYLELGETGAILTGYLDNVIMELEQTEVRDELGLTLDGSVAQEAARAVLKSMITAERTKTVVSGREITYSEIITRPGIAPAQVEALLTYLVDKRIIRRLPDSDRYELAHEVMIEKVWEWVSEEERHTLDLQDMLARATSDYRKFHSLLPPDRLSLLTEHADRLSLDEDALELLLLSGIEHNLDPDVWASRMESDRSIEVLVELLETRKRIRYVQIARALGHTHSPKAIRYLQDLLQDESYGIQRSAVDALVNIGLPIVVRPLYYAAQREDRLIRVAPIVDALEELHSDDAADMLMLLASEHTNLHVRSRATNALLRLGYSKGILLIVRQLSSDDPVIRQNAVNAAKRILEENPDEFESVLHDADPQVRLGAAKALKTVGDKRAVALLTQVLQDENTEVRREVVSALGQLGDERAVEPLVAALRDKDVEVRLSVMRGLGALWELPMLIQLGSGSARVRQEAASALGRSGNERAVEPLLAALHDKDSPVQREAASALGQLGDERAVEPLVAALQDEEAEEVRREAAGALGQLGDERAVEPLVAALQDEDAEVRRRAVSALAQLGDVRAVGSLAVVLRDEDTGVQRAAAISLGELGDARAVEPLVVALRDGDAEVQRVAATALGRLGDKRAVEPLVAALQDGDAEVRRRAVSALAQLGDERAVEPLLTALQGEEAEVRREAASVLGQLGDKRAVEPLLVVLRDEDAGVRLLAMRALGALWELPMLVQLGSESAEVRRRAVNALGQLEDVRVVEPLLVVLRDEDIEVRRRTVSTLAQLGDGRAVEPLLTALRDKNAFVRREATHALGKLRDKRAVEPLSEALQDRSPMVRQWAAIALGWLEDTRVVDMLIAALNDSAPGVRGGATSALGRLGDTRALEPLLKTLNDKDSNVRQWAATALGWLGDARAVKPLMSLLQDDDAEVRQRAAGALGRVGNEQATESLVAALEDPAMEVRRRAASALGWLNMPQAVEPLLEKLKEDVPNVWQWAACALGWSGNIEAIEPLLIALCDREAVIRQEAASALGVLGDTRASDSLMSALQDTDSEVRQQIVEALGKLGERRAIEPLRTALSDKSQQVRRAATEALLALGEEAGSHL